MSSKRSFRITLSTDSQCPCFAHRKLSETNASYMREFTDFRSNNWPYSEKKSFVVKLPYNLCFRRLKKLKLPAQLDSFKLVIIKSLKVKAKHWSHWKRSFWKGTFELKIVVFKKETIYSWKEFFKNVCCVTWNVWTSW